MIIRDGSKNSAEVEDGCLKVCLCDIACDGHISMNYLFYIFGYLNVILLQTSSIANSNFIEGKEKIGISSGASVPRIIVDQLVDRIKNQYPDAVVHKFENPEKNIVFALPKI